MNLIEDKPLVSVVIAVYNDERFVGDAIRSVLTQSYDNFELIIVNDGSTDATNDVIYGFSDERIRYFYQPNRGPSAAFNEGIRRSIGSFWVVLGSDDMMTPDFIARHIEEFRKHPEVDLIYCDDHLLNEDGDPIRVIKRPECADRNMLIRDTFKDGYPIVPFRTCMKKSIFDKIGLFDESLRVGVDFDMIRKFLKAGLTCRRLKAPLYLRRLTTDSVSRGYSEDKARMHFRTHSKFVEDFSCEELFPNVDWRKIPVANQHMHKKCLAALVCMAQGKMYVENNLPVYANVAVDTAREHLKQYRPESPGVQGLLDKCERIQRQLNQTYQVHA